MAKRHTVRFAQVSEAIDNPEQFVGALHDDWVMIDTNGRRFTKEQQLQLLREFNLSMDSIDLEDVDASLFGDTVVVTGYVRIQAKVKDEAFRGYDVSGRYRFVHVWKDQSERNLMDVASKSTNGFDDLTMITCVIFAAS